MKITKIEDFIDKKVQIFVRYGFKKKIDEIQSYHGKLINVNKYGVILERNIVDSGSALVNDFFPWHNIDVIRYRP